MADLDPGWGGSVSGSRVDALAVLAEVASWDRLEAAPLADHSWPGGEVPGVHGEGDADVT